MQGAVAAFAIMVSLWGIPVLAQTDPNPVEPTAEDSQQVLLKIIHSMVFQQFFC